MIPCTLLTAAFTLLIMSALPLRGWFVLFAAAFSAAVVTATLHLSINFSRFKIPSVLCHLGFAIFAAGVLLSGFLSETYRVELPIHKPAATGNLLLLYEGIHGSGSDRIFVISLDKKKERTIAIPFHVAQNGSFSATLPVITRGLAGDIYLFAEGFIPRVDSKKIEETLIVNITFKKYILLVWTGFFLVATGLLLPLILKRKGHHAD